MRLPFIKTATDLREEYDRDQELVLAKHEISILKDQLDHTPIVVNNINTKADQKLQAVYRFLSGEDEELEAALIKQLGNRLGLSSPTVENIYARCNALQGLAVTLDQIRNRLQSIYIGDIEFDHDEDLDRYEEIVDLAARR